MPLDELEARQARKLGDIDPADQKASAAYLEDAEQAIRSMPEEHAVIITQAGETYHVRGGTAAVNPAVIGSEALNGAIITHNHLDHAGELGGSFCDDDIGFFFSHSLEELRAVDSEYLYRLTTSKQVNIAPEALVILYFDAQDTVSKSLTIEDAFQVYDIKHLTMIELKKLIEGLYIRGSDGMPALSKKENRDRLQKIYNDVELPPESYQAFLDELSQVSWDYLVKLDAFPISGQLDGNVAEKRQLQKENTMKVLLLKQKYGI